MPDPYRTPGQLLRALLAERHWTQRILAIVLGMDETALNHVVADRRPITAELAVSLEDVFGVPADTFLDLQKSFDLAKARFTAQPDPRRAIRARLFGDLPVREMIKRRWLTAESVRDVHAVESSLANFFGVGSPDEIENIPHATKKTGSSATTPAQLAWLYRVRQIAKEMLAPKYSPELLRAAIDKLSRLLLDPEDARKAPRILAECGIRFVIVETIASAKIDGACFWLDAQSPVIGMTTRYDRIDNFWFVLRHECEHVLRVHGLESPMLDAELEGARAGSGSDIQAEEREANEAAADFCISRETMKAFVARKAPYFAERDLLALAHLVRVHPGIVAGQLQHVTGRYDLFKHHFVKIRAIVAPGAMVDGWGDVAPVGA
jgi:HTH-type transcriptional regulator/antitoxin HigA